MIRHALLTLLVAPATGCNSNTPPADFAGQYTINATNRMNECQLDGWTVGDAWTGVPVAITQSGSAVSIRVQGALGAGLELFYGGSQFDGSVSGDRVHAKLTGAPGSDGSCAFTPYADLDGVLSGDTITGYIYWRYDTNSSSDCGVRAACENEQVFNGTRPLR
jgi:hypothetical protein